jgi:hypothetical protein
MARCRECGAKVWRKAEYCQHCGTRSPVKGIIIDNPNSGHEAKPKARFGFFKGIGLILLLMFAVAVFRNVDGSASSPAAAACSSDWTKCTDNADLINHYSELYKAKTGCKISAEEKALYGTPKWPWLSFGRFFAGVNYVQTGRATLIEPDAQFQNGFGAMVHSRVLCVYDLKTDRVVSIDIVSH